MMEYERERLLALLRDENAWCQDVEARDKDGNPVRYDVDVAVAWDLTGALCHLFGWKRACVLFEQLSRHILRKKCPTHVWRNPHLHAMAELQAYNDREEMTHAEIMEILRTTPVWHGPGHGALHAAQ
jgi:hypothetical protein